MVCNFSSVAFSVFGFPIHWYSLAYIFGLLIAWQRTNTLAVKIGGEITVSQIEDFLSTAIIGIILGGRLGHVLFYDFGFYASHLTEIFKVWKGGMSFYGGFLGVIVATVIFCRNHKISFLKFIDLWSVSVPIGLFLGRIANLINGELPGKPSDVSWAIILKDGIKRHPSQIYEAILEGILLFLVMIFAFKKQCYKYAGRLSGIFCAGYGCARFTAEFFREPDSLFSYKLLYMSGMNLNQYMSIAMFLLGVYLIVRSKTNE